MIFELDDLLDKVDRWKFKLYHKLKRLTPSQRAAFWQKTSKQAAEAGLPVLPAGQKIKSAKRGA